MLLWADNNLLDLKWEEIGEHYGRYRLHVPEAERAMARSLERYGQLSPVVVCRRQDRYELIDGFKRLGAVRGLAQIPRLSARLMEADERQALSLIHISWVCFLRNNRLILQQAATECTSDSPEL